jgi:hypothetical protein
MDRILLFLFFILFYWQVNKLAYLYSLSYLEGCDIFIPVLSYWKYKKTNLKDKKCSQVDKRVILKFNHLDDNMILEEKTGSSQCIENCYLFIYCICLNLL